MRATRSRRPSPVSVRSARGFRTSVGIFRLTQNDSERGAAKAESFTQAVYQIANIGLRQFPGVRAEDDESRRPGIRLRHVAQLDAAAAGCGRRMALDHLRKPAVERGGRDAPVPDVISRQYGLHQAIEVLAT